MHSRWTRPMELARNAPRTIHNLYQWSPAQADIDTASSASVGANQICTGYSYGHASAGGGVDLVSLGIHSAKLSGIQPARVDLSAPIAFNFGDGLTADAWPNHDKQQHAQIGKMQTALKNPPGYPTHIWEGSSFNGSHSTQSYRQEQETDQLPPKVTRPIVPPAPKTAQPRQVPWSARFFYGATGVGGGQFGQGTARVPWTGGGSGPGFGSYNGMYNILRSGGA